MKPLLFASLPILLLGGLVGWWLNSPQSDLSGELDALEIGMLESEQTARSLRDQRKDLEQELREQAAALELAHQHLGEARLEIQRMRGQLGQAENARRAAEEQASIALNARDALEKQVTQYRAELLTHAEAVATAPEREAAFERRIAELESALSAARSNHTEDTPSTPATVLSVSDDGSVIALDRGYADGLAPGSRYRLEAPSGAVSRITLTEVRTAFAIGRIDGTEGFRSALVKGHQLRLSPDL